MATAPFSVAYFSMEVGFEQGLPTYSGGLGVLAGDTLRSAADLAVPMVGITLVHRCGYFTQHLAADGAQTNESSPWDPESRLPRVSQTVTVQVEGRTVHVGAFRYDVRGVGGHVVPVYLLDTRLPENDPYDQALTDTLYGGDNRYRLCQEVVLGMAGAAMLDALGVATEPGLQYHINEGHAALLTLHLLGRQLDGRPASSATVSDVEAVARRVIFTTHTPVPAGHDKFSGDLARQVLGEQAALLDACTLWDHGELNMTRLALRCSRYINGVALRHAEVSREMFPEYQIAAVTNGVHAVTWTAEPFRQLFDRHFPEWRRDNYYLRYAITLPADELREAHRAAKRLMLDEVARRTNVTLDPDAFTIGFARRSATYKRADLVFSDLDRLRRIAKDVGPIQFVFAGKAHPRDVPGQTLIRRVHAAQHALGDALRVVYVPNYEMALGALLTSGADVWLNNPVRPLEASGTSGMKSALNGVPSLSVIDGWWVEGCVEGSTGWAIGTDDQPFVDPNSDASNLASARADATALYDKLEQAVVPLFYGSADRWTQLMRTTISVNGSFFNTQRMVAQYVQNAYLPGAGLATLEPAQA